MPRSRRSARINLSFNSGEHRLLTTAILQHRCSLRQSKGRALLVSPEASIFFGKTVGLIRIRISLCQKGSDTAGTAGLSRRVLFSLLNRKSV